MPTRYKTNKDDSIQILSKMKHGDTLENVKFKISDEKETINDNETTMDMEKSTILCRVDHSTKQRYYEVFSSTPLEGSNKVFPIHTTFQLNGNKEIETINNGPQRVIKRCNKEEASLMRREYMCGKSIPYLNMQPIVKSAESADNKKSYYLIMDKIPGSTLEELLNDKTIANLDSDKRLILLLSLFESLQTIHKEKLIHTNIQPENIIVNFEGEQSKPQAYIIGFKCAKSGRVEDIGPLSKWANTNEIIRYMPDSSKGRIYNDYTPPETCNKGMGTHGSEASDVYSLGKIFSDIIKQWHISDSQLNQIVKEMTREKDNERIELDKAISSYSDWMLNQYKKIVPIKLKLLEILNDNPTFTSILESENIDLKPISKELNNPNYIENIDKDRVISINQTLNGIKVLENFKKCHHKQLGNTLIECFKYATNIKEEKEDKTINELKVSIINAVYTYVQKTYQSNSQDRAASERRIKNINDLLTILNNTKDTDTLKEKIIEWNKTIKRGFLGRSTLYDEVAQAAKITPVKSTFWSKLNLKNSSSIEISMEKNSCPPVVGPIAQP